MDLSTLPPVPDSPDDLLELISWPGSDASGDLKDQDDVQINAERAPHYHVAPQQPSVRPFSPTRTLPMTPLSLDTSNLDITQSSRLSTESLVTSIVESFFTPVEPPLSMSGGQEDREFSPRSVMVVGYQSPTTASDKYETGSTRSIKFEELQVVDRIPFVPVPEAMANQVEKVVEKMSGATARGHDGQGRLQAVPASKSDEELDAVSANTTAQTPANAELRFGSEIPLDSRRSSLTIVKSAEPAQCKPKLLRTTRETAPSPPDTSLKLVRASPKKTSTATVPSRLHKLQSETIARFPSPARSNILVPIPIGVTTSEDSSDAEPQMQVPSAPAKDEFKSRPVLDVRRNTIGPPRYSRPTSPQHSRPHPQQNHSGRAFPKPHVHRVKRDTLDSSASRRNVKQPAPAQSSVNKRTLSLLQQVKDKLRTDESWIYVLKGLVAEHEEERRKECTSQSAEAVPASLSRPIGKNAAHDSEALRDGRGRCRVPRAPRKSVSELVATPRITVQAPSVPPPTSRLGQQPEPPLPGSKGPRGNLATADSSRNDTRAPRPATQARVQRLTKTTRVSPIVKSRPLRCLIGTGSLNIVDVVGRGASPVSLAPFRNVFQ
ncbi:hypothetical protein OIV83_006075 [Microbotryomycetes sp. JL201]|nr:hypothetical protein OIV83_006075 [Microbotryomycetes sp. JL201]